MWYTYTKSTFIPKVPLYLDIKWLIIINKKSQKKIHINLPEDLHRRLRVECAYQDISIQEYVKKLIQNSLRKVRQRRSTKG